TPQERLQPSLLDRLTDDDPEHQQESREQRVLSLRRLRDYVRRDLAWLFNCTNLAAVQDLGPYPEVAQSVLNFGIPELSGTTVSSIPVSDLERQIRKAVTTFEPRILANKLQVRLTVDTEEMNHQALTFEIVGELWAQPVPEQLYLKTEIDLEIGDVRVTESAGRY
ncbi:MAG: type VI secretion system baseplate subunit TssE, partial [Candidatus Competibacterales bacterium]|nr:type VI secretion system baseplate subunit TssE [Candidatus Competibacterales bacterium]